MTQSAVRIDSHVHLWTIGQHGQSWPTPDLAQIYRDFLPEDLLSLIADQNIEQVILVQSQPTTDDTEYLLDIAANNDAVLGVVGWCDLAADDVGPQLDRYRARGPLVGVRPMLQAIAPSDWIAGDELRAGLDEVEKRDLVFDALVDLRHLDALATMKASRPALRMVIDHGAKPAIGDQALFEDWRCAMARLAGLPNVYCKLSGLLTEAPTGATAGDLRPYVDVLLAIFGPEKLLWGSDWPVLTLSSNYGDWLSMAKDLCHNISPSSQNEIFGDTAWKLYAAKAVT
ncbi:amidohydrolase family protein [Parvularcula sp. LCG005]|uniref:amidohydrolase family protein n=1 Tax=Parvularcula sp. LCG005 TaxID=3078805 RepID=UPI002943DBEB|nr:amidohydrolase family protein [Parvularcula sp. LCG005]WOI52162.1 amidohydrolase family protein [Parvularcula sp. LCG005]